MFQCPNGHNGRRGRSVSNPGPASRKKRLEHPSKRLLNITGVGNQPTNGIASEEMRHAKTPATQRWFFRANKDAGTEPRTERVRAELCALARVWGAL